MTDEWFHAAAKLLEKVKEWHIQNYPCDNCGANDLEDNSWGRKNSVHIVENMHCNHYTEGHEENHYEPQVIGCAVADGSDQYILRSDAEAILEIIGKFREAVLVLEVIDRSGAESRT